MKKVILTTVIILSAVFARAEVNLGPINWIINNWSAIDSSYIEPSHYDFVVMPSYQLSQERFRVKTSDGMEMNFRSNTANKLGVSAGWQFLVAGLSWDFNYHVDQDFDEDRKKTEFSMNIFSQLFNIDLFYRQTGGDFQMTKLDIPSLRDVKYDGKPINQELMDEMNDQEYDSRLAGSMIRSKMIGFNGYYIFNHKKFSYPAAWTNASRQKRSSGSALAGFGYTRHTIDNHLWMLPYIIASAAASDIIPGLETEEQRDNFMKHSNLCTAFRYNDWSFWGGYAYNWVPCKNLLIGASATLGVGIKKSSGDNDVFIECVEELKGILSDTFCARDPYSFSRTTVDWNAVGRVSVVWNNDRFFGGGRANVNYYRYRNGDSLMKFDNTFWGTELYFGVKFGASSYWKKKNGLRGFSI